jgi:hypothetical protein
LGSVRKPSRVRLASLISFCVASFGARSASATSIWVEPSPEECVTRSDRSPREVTTALTSGPDGPWGVTIVAGETLCLSLHRRGHPDGSGPVSSFLQIAEPGGGVVAISLDPAGPTQSLHVRTSNRRRLDLTYDVIDPPQGASDSVTSFPGGFDLALPGAPVRELLLRDYALSMVPRPEPTIEARAAAGELLLGPGVALFRSLGGLDRALVASGYASFPRVAPTLDVLLDFAIRRWRFGMVYSGSWMRADSRTSAASVRATLTVVGCEGGYEFFRWRGLTGFARTAISIGTFTVDAAGPGWNYLGAGTAALGNPTTIQRDPIFASLELGFEQLVPLASEVYADFSVRAGYSQAFAAGDWFSSENHAQVADPNGVDFSSSWIRLGFGIALSDP